MISAAASDVGKQRENNQDAFYLPNDKSMPLYIVADGMGGHKAGEVASSMALDIIEKKLIADEKNLSSADKIKKSIKEAIEIANTKIYLKSLRGKKYGGMGTTLTLAYIYKNHIIIGHVGDSRAYLIEEGKITQITEDHSFVNELVKTGSITKEEAENHPKRNMITRAVGTSSIIEMDLIDVNYREGSILILCSDGLFNMVKDDEILQVFKSESDLDKACQLLVNLANSRGGIDNITVLAIKLI